MACGLKRSDMVVLPRGRPRHVGRLSQYPALALQAVHPVLILGHDAGIARSAPRSIPGDLVRVVGSARRERPCVRGARRCGQHVLRYSRPIRTRVPPRPRWQRRAKPSLQLCWGVVLRGGAATDGLRAAARAESHQRCRQQQYFGRARAARGFGAAPSACDRPSSGVTSAPSPFGGT